jgi:hypothetical protein
MNMLLRSCLTLAWFAAIPAWAQVAPSATGTESTPDDSSQMMTPPAVSSQPYPTEVGAEAQSNYLRGGIVINTAYIDSLYAGDGSNAQSETTITILPTISYDKTIPRQHISFTYSPGFTYYHPSGALNEFDQNVTAAYQYHMTPHVILNANDTFERSSTFYGLQDSFGGGSVSGASPSLTPGIVAPFAQRQTNAANAELSYQYSLVGMVGGSGSLTNLDYPNSSESTGLYNSDQRGGGAFYNRRISASQYVGMNYQYAWIATYPQDTESKTETQTFIGFYSVYPRHDLTISISGGPQRYTIAQTGVPATSSWGPSVTASVGWQGSHTSASASYSKEVTSGGGLLGAFDSNSGHASLRWQFTRTWTAGVGGNYAENKSVTPSAFSSEQGGHSISGQATVGHTLSQQLSLNFEYDRTHQDYSSVAAVSGNPNSDREMISLAWQFSRPLGR